MKPTLRLIAGLLITTSLAVTPVFAEGKKAPQGLPAEVITVKSQALEQSIRAVGNLRANESIQLSPEQSGRIEKVLFEEGVQVKKDQALFALNSSIYKAELKQAQARVNLSKIAYTRAVRLLKKGVGSVQDRDSTLAQLRVDEAQKALAQTRLDKMTIRAPFTGITGLRLTSPGDYVNVGQALVELTDLHSLKADFRVPEIYLASLKAGSKINIQVDAFPGKTFPGEVYAIAPGADSRSHNILLRARIPNDNNLLRPGLFAQVNLIIERNNAAIVIPEQAIIPQNGGFFVMRVAAGNIVERVPVTMGQRRPGTVQITQGLSAGDVVITAGQLKLFPGMPVTPIFTDGSQAAVQGG
ncbi:MAG: efflux RND transporter periplasmic adaptor subunit [Pontibacterium sp.]